MNLEIDRIIVATDLSETAWLGYRHAQCLARALEVPVELLYVLEDPDLSLDPTPELIAFQQSLRETCQGLLQQAATQLASEGIRPIATLRHAPRVWRGVLDHLDDQPHALLIVGQSSTMTTLGSTTNRVLRHAKGPVLVFDLQGYDKPPAIVDVRRVMVPVDFSTHSEIAARIAQTLAQRLNADLVLLHVYSPGLLLPAPLGPALAIPEHFGALVNQSYADKLAALASRLRQNGIRVEVHALESPTVVGALTAYADEETDLFVLPSHGRTALEHIVFGSTTEHLLRQTTRPVLVLRRPYLRHIQRG